MFFSIIENSYTKSEILFVVLDVLVALIGMWFIVIVMIRIAEEKNSIT
jgi:hypothetical protein